MAIWNEIGKKLSGAGQEVARTTKEMMETSRLNSSINDKKKMIAQMYTVLGEAYYKRHANDPEAEEPEIIARIRTLNAEMDETIDEVLKLKNKGKCPNCGATAQVPAGGSKQCEYCLTWLSVDAKGKLNVQK